MMLMIRFSNLWQNLLSSPRWTWRFFWLCWGLILWSLLVSVPVAIAAPFPRFGSGVDPAHQTAIDVKVELGNAANELRFVPNELTFKAGQRYQLHLSDPSALKHYFTAKDFADTIWTQKVEAGNVEVKGAIHELELRPGSSAEWVFIPLKAGTYELHCSVPGHAEAGMTGALTVES
jgi:uncharacterized cupredoxin-like copper-binding protein